MFSSKNKLKNSFVGKKKPNPIFQSLYGGKNLGFEMSLVCHNKRGVVCWFFLKGLQHVTNHFSQEKKWKGLACELIRIAFYFYGLDMLANLSSRIFFSL